MRFIVVENFLEKVENSQRARKVYKAYDSSHRSVWKRPASSTKVYNKLRKASRILRRMKTGYATDTDAHRAIDAHVANAASYRKKAANKHPEARAYAKAWKSKARGELKSAKNRHGRYGVGYAWGYKLPR